MFKEFMTRLRFLVRPKRHGEVDDELRFHLEQQVEANLAAGMTPHEARREATIAFGGVERAREGCREQRPGYWLDTLLQDVRYALRGFRRSPTFTLTVVFTLMLGIGATTAVFSVVDRILFRSLPYRHPDRLVSVGLVAPIIEQEFMLGGSYYEWRDHQSPFESFSSTTGVDACDLTEEKPLRLSCASVEASLLSTLGVSPMLGRNFTAGEDRPNAPKVALISYQVWKNRFGLDRNVLNRLMSLDGQPVRVIGVLPKDFEMPTLDAADVVRPQALDEAAQRIADPGRVMYAFARLRPGVSVEQAKAALAPVFDYSLRLAPAQFRKEIHLRVRSLRDRQMQNVRLASWVLFGLVMAVLLIACANVTSLLMARGAARERELAVRSALGASRARLARQALTESLVLSVAGGGAGCIFTELLLKLFVTAAREGISFLEKARIDGRVLLFALAISLLCGTFAGLVPAMRRSRAEVLGGRTTTTVRHAVLRQWLVAGQISASMVLLAAGALLFRSFSKLESQPLGMNTQSIVTASLSLGQRAYPTAVSQMALFQRLQRELRYGPGVTALAISDSLPPGSYHRDQVYASLVTDGRPRWTDGTGGLVTWRWVTPDYFQTLGIPMMRGVGFREEELDSNDHFVVLSNALAGRVFPGQDPIRQRLQLGGGGANDPWYTVAGVAADVKNGSLAGGDEPEYYRLRRNRAEDWNRDAAFLVKANLPAEVMEGWIRSRVAAIDPTLPIDVLTMSERVDKMADQPRFETMLVGFFAAAGLLLSVVGLYGVIAFLVVQRRLEIGVRMTLGATRGDILGMVVRSGLRLIIPGALVGVFAALAGSRLLSSLLFSIGPHDPGAFAGVTLLMILVALFATLVPALSATGVDPAIALRCD